MKASIAIVLIFVFTLYFKNTAGHEIDGGDRKKRSLDDGAYRNIDRDEMDALLELIRKSPWSIMLFGDGSSGLLNYIPKEDQEMANDDDVELVRRSMFAPRLGRSAFFPTRIGRSAFFPTRIGRSAFFPTRIGRSAFFPTRIGRDVDME